MELPDPIVDVKALPETGHQSFTLIALTQTGRVFTCGSDWIWYDITPGQGEPDGDAA